ncbi:translational GTPase TypA [bacterium]|jgi:GTP-binding protein|nr:translational GTPase TypA [bacterium]
MSQENIRNVAIIAHVDHGKTTMVDQLFRQSGMWRDNQDVSERLMDSSDIEKERGITITSKNGSCVHNGTTFNIIDTPGHADFGGEVERVLKMSDGAIFLVDAAEGPMPQSYFVLKKAIAQNLPVIVVVNKIDKDSARCDWVVDQVFDLLVALEAPDDTLDFPVIYASARDGIAKHNLEDDNTDVIPLFEAIVKKIPPPNYDESAAPQMLVSSISYSPFMGRLAIGKITGGSFKVNQDAKVMRDKKPLETGRITKVFHFKANEQVEVPEAGCGDIVAIAGLQDVTIGDTITDPVNPVCIDGVKIDPPTMSVTFLPNDSPFAGREGEFVTGNQIKDRLIRETLADVALTVEPSSTTSGYIVSGRGELHLSILIERMRREGYEFQVSRPQVLMKVVDGKKLEPYEELTIDVPEQHSGKIIETLGALKGEMLEMIQNGAMTRLKYSIPTRGLMGYQTEFMTYTKGEGTLNYMFEKYGPFVGEIKTRKNGVLISKETCETIAFALQNLQQRGTLFMGPGHKIYGGQIIGQSARDDDMVVNPGKGKKLSNMRASGTDENIVLSPPKILSLEQMLSFISDDELVEVTPKNIRLRKKDLNVKV